MATQSYRKAWMFGKQCTILTPALDKCFTLYVNVVHVRLPSHNYIHRFCSIIVSRMAARRSFESNKVTMNLPCQNTLVFTEYLKYICIVKCVGHFVIWRLCFPSTMNIICITYIWLCKRQMVRINNINNAIWNINYSSLRTKPGNTHCLCISHLTIKKT